MCAVQRPVVKSGPGGEVENPPVPGPDTFSLEEFIEEKSTYPVVMHSVFLDQDGGLQLNDVQEKIQTLESEMDKLADSASSGPKTLDEAGVTAKRKNQITKDLRNLRKTEKDLTDRVMKSALLLEFECLNPNEIQRRQDDIMLAFLKEKLGLEKLPDDEEYKDILEGEHGDEVNRHLNVSRLAALCSRISRGSDGSALRGPFSVEQLESLLNKLGTSEYVRLMTAITSTLKMSTSWADRLDAGFPGRGTDMAR